MSIFFSFLALIQYPMRGMAGCGNAPAVAYRFFQLSRLPESILPQGINEETGPGIQKNGYNTRQQLALLMRKVQQ